MASDDVLCERVRSKHGPGVRALVGGAGALLARSINAAANRASMRRQA